MGRRMQPRNEKFFTRFSKAGSNIVESAAMLRETMMPLPHRLPRAEPLGKITPRHPVR